MLQKYIESNFELNNLDLSRLGFIKKIKKNSPFFFNFKLNMSLCFLFCNIVNIDLFLINRFLLVFWIFTGCVGRINNLKTNLRLGVYYYHFLLNYNIKKRKFYTILSFLLDDFLINQFWDGYKFLDNNFFFYFKNLELLTNYKLARGVYFYRIQQKFYLRIFFNKLICNFYKLILSSYKLYVIKF